MITGDLRRWAALLVVCAAQMMILVDATIVNVALPVIRRDLGFVPADLTWVVDAYAISYGGFVLVAGRAGDLVGRRRVFLAGVAVFTLASVACGLAPSAPLLVAARFVQGAGAAFAAGVVIAVIVAGFPEPRDRARAMSIFAFTIAGGGSLGLLLGGVLTQAVSWRLDFFINLPIGIATLAAGLLLLDENPRPALSRRIDVAGAVLVTTALMVGVYAIVTAAVAGWASPHTLGLGATSTLLMGAFVGLQARRPHALVPVRAFRIRTLSGGSAARGLLATAIFSSFFFGALYMQQVRGYSALGTGLAFLPFSVANGATSIVVVPRLVERLGARRVLVAGLVCIVGALLVLSTAGAGTAYFPELLAVYAVFGFGAGLSMMPLTLLAMVDVPAADAGLAAGISNASMQVAAALGLAVLGTIAASAGRSPIAGYELAFRLAAGLVAGALLVTLLVLRSRDGAARRAEELELEEAA